MISRFRLCLERNSVPLGRSLCLAAIAWIWALDALAETRRARDPEATELKETQQFCTNIAGAAEVVRLDRQRKELADLQQQVATRLAALETRRAELNRLIEKLEAFERKGDDSLVGLYSQMKPEAAAAQLGQLDDDTAAALMLKIKTKLSSAILNEMDAARGAALAKRIAQLRTAREGKLP